MCNVSVKCEVIFTFWRPHSSSTSRMAHCSMLSPGSWWPFGRSGVPERLMIKIRLFCCTTPPAALTYKKQDLKMEKSSSRSSAYKITENFSGWFNFWMMNVLVWRKSWCINICSYVFSKYRSSVSKKRLSLKNTIYICKKLNLSYKNTKKWMLLQKKWHLICWILKQ